MEYSQWLGWNNNNSIKCIIHIQWSFRINIYSKMDNIQQPMYGIN